MRRREGRRGGAAGPGQLKRKGGALVRRRRWGKRLGGRGRADIGGPGWGRSDFSPQSPDAHSQEFSAVTFSRRAGRSEPSPAVCASPPRRGRGQGAGPEKGLRDLSSAPLQSLLHIPAARTDGRSRGSPRGLLTRCALRSRLRRRSGAPSAPLSRGAGGKRPLCAPFRGEKSGRGPHES